MHLKGEIIGRHCLEKRPVLLVPLCSGDLFVCEVVLENSEFLL